MIMKQEQVRKMSREEKLEALALIDKNIEATKLKLDQLNKEAYNLQYELGYYAKKEILYGIEHDKPKWN